MESKPSLFASARPRVALPKTKKTRGFLDLPGEIRNQIYKYSFQDSFRCELVGQGCDFSSVGQNTIKILSNTTVRSKPPIKHCSKTKSDDPIVIRLPPRGPSTRHTALSSRTCWLDYHCALVLVCKQMYAETLPLLYQRITFVFEAPRRIIGFLKSVTEPNLNHVTKLHLHYATYGNPLCARDVAWQEKHIESWTRACKKVSQSLTYLRTLEIEISVNEDAPKFNLRQKWLQPLLQFRRLTCTSDIHSAPICEKPRTLEIVNIKFKTRLWKHDFEHNTRLSKACKHLHRLFGQGISSAILGAKEEEAMVRFNTAWNGKYKIWQHHLGFARTGW